MGVGKCVFWALGNVYSERWEMCIMGVGKCVLWALGNVYSERWEMCILGVGKCVFWAFVDLETAYDTFDRHCMWQMLGVYGVEED